MQRKDEILAKKAKLAELRRQREEREARQKEHGNKRESLLPGDDSDVKAPSPRRTTDRKELDSFIDTLVGDRPGSRGPGAASPAGRKSRPSSTLSASVPVGTETYERNADASEKAPTTDTGTQTLSTGPAEVAVEQTPAVESTPAVEQTPDVTKEKYVTNEIGVQTAEPWSPRKPRKSRTSFSDAEDELVAPISGSPKSTKRMSRRQKERADILKENLRKEVEEELKAAQNATTNGDAASKTPRYPTRELTEEELTAVTASEEFLEFVDRSSKVIEKALDQDYDVLADYSLDGVKVDEDEDEGYASGRGKSARRIKQVAQFYDERWCKKRMISDLGFSPKFPELLLASYTKNASAPQDPAGLLQIWNLHLHSRPEYTFYSTSDILTARFSPFHPSLIIGGTYTGQVLLWDTRARNPNPVQKTPLTGASTGGHTHPIYSISLVGTQNANNIISCSTDGVVCGWTTEMLTLPQEYLELTTPPPSKTEDLAPTCMAFPESDPTSFLVGTEEGTIFPCHRYDRAGAKAGVDAKLRYKAHSAPVMSLAFHPASGAVDLGDLVLSTSLDWTIKLWKTRPASSTAVQQQSSAAVTASQHSSSSATTSTITGASGNSSTSAPAYGANASTTTTSANAASTSSSSSSSEIYLNPLLSLPRENIVYDARWSPHKPGVFASVDGGGNLEVWDLSLDTEVPVARAQPSVDHTKAGLEGYVVSALNRVCWEGREGRRVATGGGSGVVSVFEVGGGLCAGEGPGGGVGKEEWGRVKRLAERGGR